MNPSHLQNRYKLFVARLLSSIVLEEVACSHLLNRQSNVLVSSIYEEFFFVLFLNY